MFISFRQYPKYASGPLMYFAFKGPFPLLIATYLKSLIFLKKNQCLLYRFFLFLYLKESTDLRANITVEEQP